MNDIVLDTNILTDLLAQYYQDRVHERGFFESKARLDKELIKKINQILRWHQQTEQIEETSGFFPLLIASSFAFVEIARQFERLSLGHYSIEQFAAFIEQPPEWFLISSVDETLIPFFCLIPPEVKLPNGDIKPLEIADIIHIATTMSRGETCLLASSDSRIKNLEILRARILCQ